MKFLNWNVKQFVTTLATILCGRNSVGVDLNDDFMEYFNQRLSEAGTLFEDVDRRRFHQHQEFVHNRPNPENFFGYTNTIYEVPVKTKQEKQLTLPSPETMDRNDNTYRVAHKTWFPDQQK